MTVTTMEELAAMPVGSAIKVRQANGTFDWGRPDPGVWVRDESRVPDAMFTGLVTAGRVVDASRTDPEPGDVYRWPRRDRIYLVTAVAGRSATLMGFRHDRYVSEDHYAFTDMARVFHRVPPNDVPEWIRTVWSATQPLLSRATVAEAALEDRNATVSTLNESVAELQRQQANRPGTVQVRVQGTSQVPTEKADGHVPDSARVDSVVARWQASLSLETSGAGCLCHQVTSAWVVEQLGIDPAQPSGTFEFSANCGRHDA
jgi:hypothetical protein